MTHPTRSIAPKQLSIVIDFDKTLTQGSINGKVIPSIIAMLRDGNHLTEDYAAQAHALYDHYSRIEKDMTLTHDTRSAAMQEWREHHNDLLIASGLRYQDLEDIAEHGEIALRQGATEFLGLLHQHNIPVIIVTASGCGEAIPLFLRKYGCEYPNISYVINAFQRDADGKAIASKPPIIHGMNKNSILTSQYPMFVQTIRDRGYALVIGDSPNDADMIKNVPCAQYKIGFWNNLDDTGLEGFADKFDMVIKGDGPMDEITALVKNMFL